MSQRSVHPSGLVWGTDRGDYPCTGNHCHEPLRTGSSPPPYRSRCGVVFVLAIVIGLIVGFIGGAIWAFIYNVAATHVGPIEMELEMKS